MKKLLILCLVILMTLPVIPAYAATVYFTASGERYHNGVNTASRCLKSTDGEQRFYVTVDDIWSLSDDDKIYFGSRRVNDDGSTSNSMSNGVSFYWGKDIRQVCRYTTYAPGGVKYALNIKQDPDGPGTFFLLDLIFTP